MSGRAISDRVVLCGERAGVPGLNGHSLRSGLAVSSRWSEPEQTRDRTLGPHLRALATIARLDSEAARTR
nr:hypothetical protein GCM10010200_023900 [Actinomadura rugatobispora]